jgi:hypothetical protein
VRYTGIKVDIFVDGVLDISAAHTGALTSIATTQPYIGVYNSSSLFYSGLMAGVGYLPYSISQAQITATFQYGPIQGVN